MIRVICLSLMIGMAPVLPAAAQDGECQSTCLAVNAVKNDNVNEVRRLFESGIVKSDSSFPSERHISVLLMLTDSRDVVDVILEYNSLVDDITFVELVTNNKRYAVEKILAKGLASENAKGIAVAAMVLHREVELVKLLVDSGANVSIRDYFGKSAIDYAGQLEDEFLEIKRIIALKKTKVQI